MLLGEGRPLRRPPSLSTEPKHRASAQNQSTEPKHQAELVPPESVELDSTIFGALHFTAIFLFVQDG
ncbi:Unannotated [Lentimonas sp. CC19]|nr:Unannotated [Lentimonas sp. CC19]